MLSFLGAFLAALAFLLAPAPSLSAVPAKVTLPAPLAPAASFEVVGDFEVYLNGMRQWGTPTFKPGQQVNVRYAIRNTSSYNVVESLNMGVGVHGPGTVYFSSDITYYNVSPGAVKTFDDTFALPTVPGVYDLYGEIGGKDPPYIYYGGIGSERAFTLYIGDGPPTPTVTPTRTATATPPPFDAAELAGQAQWPVVAPGELVRFWIDVRNAGTTTWRNDYSWSGRDEWLHVRDGPIWREVRPGQTLRFAEAFTAPSTPGEYIYGFMLVHNGVEFGDYFFIKVTVRRPAITGYVRDLGTSAPVMGVMVTTNTGKATLTDAAGRYEFADLAAGDYQVTVRKIGYSFEPARKDTRVPPGREVSFMGNPFTIGNIEPAQALSNTPLLVAGKQTVIRVLMSNIVFPDRELQSLEVYYEGNLLATLRSRIALSRDPRRLDFECDMAACGDWRSGTYRFVARINGLVLEKEATFQDSAYGQARKLRILAVYVNVKVGEEIRGPAESWRTAGRFLQHVYPLPENAVDWVLHPSAIDATDIAFDESSEAGCGLFSWWPRKGSCVLMERLRALQPAGCGQFGATPCYDKIVGFIPAMAGRCSERGCAVGFTSRGEKLVAVVMTEGQFYNPFRSKVTVDSPGQAVAHEVAHTFGLGDEYDRGAFWCNVNPPPAHYVGLEEGTSKSVSCLAPPDGSGNIAEFREIPDKYGLGVLIPVSDGPYEIHPAAREGAFPRGALGPSLGFMGAAEGRYSWVSRAEWTALFGRLKARVWQNGSETGEAGAAPPVVAGEPVLSDDPTHQTALAGEPLPAAEEEAAVERLVRMSGWVAADGTVALNPAYVYSGVTPSAGLGRYLARAVNQANDVLADRAFELGRAGLSNPPDLTGPEYFEVHLAYPAGTTSLQIVRDSAVVASLPVSSAAPVVRFTRPVAGESLSGRYRVEWVATDADSPRLFARLEYSRDNLTWITVDGVLEDSAHTVDFSTLGGGTAGRLRLIVTDGVNSSQAVVGPLRVPLHSPQVTIVNPAEGAKAGIGGSLLLSGEAYDLQDGWLHDAALTWQSDVEGVLGTGNHLYYTPATRGARRLMLSARNAAGLTSKVSVTIEAGDTLHLPLVATDARSAGCGADIGLWTARPALPQPLGATFWTGRNLVLRNGRAFIFGGNNDDGAGIIDVYHRGLAAGNAAPWMDAISLPGRFYDHVEVALGDFVYLVTGAASDDAVYFARLGLEGIVGSWRRTTSHPGRQNFAVAAYGRWLYSIGGNNGGSRAFVHVATANADGSLGSWREVTALPETVEGHAAQAVNGRLYVFAPNGKTFMARIQSDGTLGAWSTTSSLPVSQRQHSVVEAGGYFYLVGGETAAVYRARITTSGTLTAWQQISTLPERRGRAWAGVYNCNLYVAGGHDGTHFRDSVYVAPLR